MDGTIIQDGSFTSTGVNVTLPIRSGFDWIKTYNYTQIAAGGAGVIQAYWQLGMPNGGGLAYSNAAALAATNFLGGTITTSGFTMVDSTQTAPQAGSTVTATSNATAPIVTTASSAGLVAGQSIVRLANVATATQLNGIDFLVSTVADGTHFTIQGPFAAAMVAGTGTGSWSLIPFDPIYYPRRRFIVNITQAASAVVTVSVPHGYTIGQEVRFNLPSSINGMVQINGMSGIITAIGSTTTFTVNINTTGFTAFTFPVTANPGAYTPAQVVPFGEDTATAEANNLSILGDATLNTGFIGVTLQSGANGPAGANNDVIYWVAGKSFNT